MPRKDEGLMSQSEARKAARDWNADPNNPEDLVAIAHPYPVGSSGGEEQGWAVRIQPVRKD